MERGMTCSVVDANIAAALVLSLPYSQQAIAHIRNCQINRIRLCAPLIWEYELVAVVRKSVYSGMLTPEQGDAALSRLLALEIERIAPTEAHHRDALRWATLLGHVAAYDAQYLALAARLGAELLTTDKRLYTRAREKGLFWVRHILDSGLELQQ